MQLGNILSTATQPVVAKPVRFRVLVSPPGEPQRHAVAEAVLAFVDEDARHESKRLAVLGLKSKEPYRSGTPIPEDELIEEEFYRFLMVALRDKDDPAQQFCPNSDYPRFRQALILRQVRWLLGQYDAFVNEEYPELLTKDQQEALLQEAQGN